VREKQGERRWRETVWEGEREEGRGDGKDEWVRPADNGMS